MLSGTIPRHELRVPSEIHQTVHDVKLLDKVDIVIHHGCSRKLQDILLTHRYSLHELRQLRARCLTLMALVDDHRAEEVYPLIEVHAFQCKPPLASDLLHKELPQALIVDDEHFCTWLAILPLDLPEPLPRSPVLIIEDYGIDATELAELPLPVDLQRCGTDDKCWVGLRSRQQADGLDGLSKTLLITKDAAFLLQSIGDTFTLVLVRLDQQVMGNGEHGHGERLIRLYGLAVLQP